MVSLRCLGGLVAVVLLAACAKKDGEDVPPDTAEVVAAERLEGAYEATSSLGEDPRAIAAIAFDGKGSYLLWRNVGCAEQVLWECPEAEAGSYTATSTTLTLREGRTGSIESIPFAFGAAGPSRGGLLGPRDLVGADAGPLSGTNIKLTNQSYQLVGKRSLPSFEAMWNGFAYGDERDVKSLIGGKVDADWITNTCTIRLSRALNEAGLLIPKGPLTSQSGLHTVTGADGRNYAYRVSEMRDYLTKTVGPPLISQSGSAIDPAAFAGKQGVIAFTVPFSDATGHFDLWDGTQPAHAEYFSRATKVEFWPAPP